MKKDLVISLFISSGNAAANEQNIVRNRISLIINATPNLPQPDWTDLHRVKHKVVIKYIKKFYSNKKTILPNYFCGLILGNSM